MNSLWRGGLGLAALVGLSVATGWSADPPAKSAEPPKPAAKDKSSPKTIDLTRLFPGAVFIVGEDAKDAVQQAGVYLSPEKLKELQDQLEQLRRQASLEKPEPPSVCRLSGRVDGDLVRLKAQFEFRTSRPRAPVVLGCQKAWPSSVSLDSNRLPILLPPSDEGFIVLVDQPGAHQLTLDLELPVVARGTERGFELALPRAAITRLEHLELPPPVREVRLGNRQLLAKELREPLALGAISKLDVAWKGPAPQQPGEPLLAAQGDISVRVDESHVTTEVELTLRALRGQTDLWRLVAPAGAHVEARGLALDDRAPAIAAPIDDKNPVWTIRLKEPSDEPLRLGIRYRQPRIGKPMGIGSFYVLNTFRQQGSIHVYAPPEVRLRYVLRGDISQREVAEELRQDPNAVAGFTYYALPGPLKGGAVLPPLDLEIEAVKGAIETPAVAHLLELDLKRPGWRVRSKIDVHPVRTTVERLDLELPADYQEVQASPVILVEDVELKDKSAERKVAAVKLASRQQPGRIFSLTVDAFVPLPADASQATLGLPVPLGTFEGGGEIAVAVPEGWELWSPELGWHTPQPGPRPQVYKGPRLPGQVSLSWRRHRPDLPIDSVVDVYLGERQASVRQRIECPVLRGGPLAGRMLELKTPSSLTGQLPVIEEGYHLAANADRTAWNVSLPEAAVQEGKPLVLTLAYSFALPEIDPEFPARRFLVPLIWPQQATRGVTKVRVWTEPGVQPMLAGGPWEEQPTEVVAGRDSLPTLVLRGSGLEIPLGLSLKESALPPLATVAIDRALFQVGVEENGLQSYRARFLITKLNVQTLDLKLPAPAPGIELEIELDGKELKSRRIVEDDPEGRTVRLQVEPTLYRRPAILEVRYKVTPAPEFEPTGTAGGWALVLAPPQLQGNVFVGRVRWQVVLPPSWVVLHVGDNVSLEQRWGWQGWLLAPRPAVGNAELERWVAVPDEAATEAGDAAASFVCWQTGLGPLRVLHLSQQVWLLGCSLAVLVLGLVLYNAALTRLQFWSVVAALGLAVIVAGLLWPDLLPVVLYGSEPGLAVLILVVGVQWLLQRHYRRQVVFMPGFQRLKPGSSMVRGSSNRPRREPSTVDAPPGSSFGAAGGS